MKTPVEYRLGIVEKLKSVVCKDRMSVYSDAEDNFKHIAERWKLYFKTRFSVDLGILPQDVAVMMCDVKISRIAATPGHFDSWLDLAGYGICGAGNVEYRSAKDFEDQKLNADGPIKPPIGSNIFGAEIEERKGQ